MDQDEEAWLAAEKERDAWREKLGPAEREAELKEEIRRLRERRRSEFEGHRALAASMVSRRQLRTHSTYTSYNGRFLFLDQYISQESGGAEDGGGGRQEVRMVMDSSFYEVVVL